VTVFFYGDRKVSTGQASARETDEERSEFETRDFYLVARVIRIEGTVSSA
jgi:hypothetical protein